MGKALGNFNTILVRLILGIFALILSVTGASAQTQQDLNNAARQAEQIQREEQLRRMEQMQRDEQSSKPSTTIEMPMPQTGGNKESTTCRDIRIIEIKGSLLLSKNERRELTAPYLNRCLTVADIEKLLGEITKEYIDRGYATTRAYIPAQDLSTGTLQIMVVEGKISSIEHADPKAGENIVSIDYLDDNMVSVDSRIYGRPNLPGAFPFTEGENLQLADLEQGIDQLNRLQSNHVSMDIQPGDKPGESRVMIKNERTRNWHVNTSYDNYGTRTTGRQQVGVTASIDSPLGYNEFLSFTRREALPWRDPDANSRSNNLYFSVPFGYTTLSAGYSDSEYQSVLTTAGGVPLSLTGDSDTLFGKVDHVLYRHKYDRLTLSGTLNKKTFNNFLAGQKLAVSSRRLSVADVDMSYMTMLMGGSAQFGFGWSRGLTWFGALKDMNGLPHGQVPHAQYNKIRANMDYAIPFEVAKQNLSFTTHAEGQHSDKALYGSEQLSIGSLYTVRGFYASTIANDYGGYIRNDLAWSKPLGQVRNIPVILRPYLGLDAGAVAGRIHGSPNGGLVGAAIGASIICGPAFFDIFTAKALVSPSSVRKEGMMTFGRMSVNF